MNHHVLTHFIHYQSNHLLKVTVAAFRWLNIMLCQQFMLQQHVFFLIFHQSSH